MRQILIAFCLLCPPLLLKGQHLHSLVIQEVFADPTPLVGLPDSEFLEIRNISNINIDLKGWKLGKGDDEIPFPASFLLSPDSFLIVCRTSAQNNFKKYGNTYGLSSFPSLPNEEGILYLRSPEGKISHCITYHSSWQSNPLKAGGGWSLEMIDPGFPCEGKLNWTSSRDKAGGTPGRKNSVEGKLENPAKPAIQFTYMPDSLTIFVWFNHPVDSASATNITSWMLGKDIKLNGIEVLPPHLIVAALHLEIPMEMAKVIEIKAKDILNCTGDVIDPMINFIPAGRNSEPLPGDIVINEIMFNPPTNGNDYVEIFNPTEKIFDLNGLFIANRSFSGSLNDAVNFSGIPRSLFPGEYRVVTEDSSALVNDYLITSPQCITEVRSLPSFPDDRGSVVITGRQGEIIDEVAYDEEWHFPLVSNKSGTPLERIDPIGASNDPNNWASAAGNLIYGTPGMVNSQYHAMGILKASIILENEVFSPDNDGHEDYLLVRYKTLQPEMMATISIHAPSGQLVKRLMNNRLLASEGMLRWDGISEDFKPAPAGLYIMISRMFSLDGTSKVFRHAFSLSRSPKN